jgi:PHD/YefM family antitoxin component YafN of YafNO toxin-antitoxin module
MAATDDEEAGVDTIDVRDAAVSLEALVRTVVEAHEPVAIAGRDGTAVLVAEGDWNAVQETLHLLSAAGVRDSIVEGMSAPVEACRDEVDW